jgi:hypothetical protein
MLRFFWTCVSLLAPVEIAQSVYVGESDRRFQSAHGAVCDDIWANCDELTRNGEDCAGTVKENGNDIKVECCRSCENAPLCQDKWSNCGELTENGTDCEGRVKETGADLKDECCRSCAPTDAGVSDPIFELIKQHAGDIDVRIILEELDFDNPAAFVHEPTKPTGTVAAEDCKDAYENCAALTKNGTDCVGAVKETGNEVKVDCCDTCKAWVQSACVDRWSNCPDITSKGNRCEGDIAENGLPVIKECCGSCKGSGDGVVSSKDKEGDLPSSQNPSSLLEQRLSVGRRLAPVDSAWKRKSGNSSGEAVETEGDKVETAADEVAGSNSLSAAATDESAASSGSNSSVGDAAPPEAEEPGAFPEANGLMVQLIESHEGKVKVKITLKGVKGAAAKATAAAAGLMQQSR